MKSFPNDTQGARGAPSPPGTAGSVTSPPRHGPSTGVSALGAVRARAVHAGGAPSKRAPSSNLLVCLERAPRFQERNSNRDADHPGSLNPNQPAEIKKSPRESGEATGSQTEPSCPPPLLSPQQLPKDSVNQTQLLITRKGACFHYFPTPHTAKRLMRPLVW